MKYYCWLFAGIFMALLSFKSQGQPGHEPVRMEVPLDKNVKPFRVFPLENRGVVLSSIEKSDDDNFDNLVVRLAGTDLSSKWIKQMPVNEELRYGAHVYGKKYLFILFLKTGREKDNNIQLFRIEIDSGSWETLGSSLDKIKSFEDMEIMENDVLIAVHTENRAYPALIKSDFQTQSITQIWQSDDKDEELLDLDIYVDKLTLLTKKDKGKESMLKLRRFILDHNSIELTQARISDFYYNITSARFIRSPKNEGFIMGTYYPGRISNSEHVNSQAVTATGVFVSKMHNDSIYTTFNSFSDFKDFYRYFETTKALKIKKKMQRNDDKEFEVGFQLLLNEPRFHNGELIFSGVSFSEQYRTISTVGYDYYGRPINIYREVFDGYLYTSAIIAAFGTQGELVWNNGLEIRDVKMMQLQNLPCFYHLKDETIIAYYYKGQIHSCIINGPETVDNFTQIPIALSSSMDRLTGEEQASIRLWYGNNFLVYGYQRINNSHRADRNRKNVFFMNKVAFE
ncbi:MAG: hypothetical protein K9I94_03410 [Bacteroidales bacterium]|nr:hypothetical protein [Bacteroidales bacterium]